MKALVLGLMVMGCHGRSRDITNRLHQIYQQAALPLKAIPVFQEDRAGYNSLSLSRDLFSSSVVGKVSSHKHHMKWLWQQASWAQVKWLGVLSEPTRLWALMGLHAGEVYRLAIGDRFGKEAARLVDIQEHHLKIAYPEPSGQQHIVIWMWKGTAHD